MADGAARLITVGATALDDAAGRMVARALRAEGMPVASRQIVDEDEAALEPVLGAALASPGLVVVLDPPGGSAGEIVRRVLARVAGSRLVLSDKLLALLEEDFTRRGQAMPRRLDRLALLPQGAEIWPAPAGAPGFALEVRGAVVAVLPLGDASLGPLVDERLRPLARRRIGSEASVLRTLLTAGLGPADAEERLGSWLGREGTVLVSTAVVDGAVVVRLLARAVSRQEAESELGKVEQRVREALGADCYGRDDETLEAVVSAALLRRGLLVSVAEACTGGLLGQRLTGVPGASRVFDRGVIAYSNRSLEDLLGVPESLLRAHGAASAPVAEAMARRIVLVSASACGLAVTGIAGPDGGTAAKPVGTVFVGCAAPAAPGEGPGVEVRRFRFAGGREAIRWQATQAALDMLRRALGRLPAPIR